MEVARIFVQLRKILSLPVVVLKEKLSWMMERLVEVSYKLTQRQKKSETRLCSYLLHSIKYKRLLEDLIQVIIFA